MKHLGMIFDRLRKHGLKLKLKKCHFMQSETSYLGYKLTRDGLKPEEDKVKAIRELEPPTTKKEIRSFIGSCSYYRKFLPNFSGIAKPLIDLTKKNTRFKWGDAHQKAFDFLKDSLTEIPFLAYPDVRKPFTLFTDASNLCIGACLTQLSDEGEELPIYFISHKLSDTQTRWSTIEKEAYAIFYAVNKLHYLLFGAQFTIKTDHQPLIYLLKAPSNNRKIQNWMLQLAAYNCKIEHIKGTDNTIADMLSRAPAPQPGLEHKERPMNEEVKEVGNDDPDIDVPDQTYHIQTVAHETKEESDNDLNVGVPDQTQAQAVADETKVESNEATDIHVPGLTYYVQTLNSSNFAPKKYATFTMKQELIDLSKLGEDLDMVEEQKKDQEISKIFEEIQTKKIKNGTRYITQDGVLYYISDMQGDPIMRLYVPTQFRQNLIAAYHDENGHFGVDKCYHTLARSYYWPNMFRDLWEHINKCIPCSQRNLKKARPPLKETDIPPYAFAKISLDLAGPFPITLSGNRYVISFVDWLSGWIESFSVPDKTADSVVYLLQTEIFPRFGCPLVLVTDNGGENLNKAMKETLEKLKIHHVKTSVFHPQSNAKVERSHRTMNDILCKLMDSKKCNTWDLHLPQVLAAIRFNYSDSTGQSPFSVLYGRDVVLPIDNLLQPRRKYYGEEAHQILLEVQHEAFLRVHRTMKKQKAKQARYADRNAKDIEYRVGDPVFLRNHKKNCKLSPSWQPYYRIIEQTSPLTFRLKNQLTGEVVKSHAEHLILAKTEWEMNEPAPDNQRRTRLRNVVSDERSSSDKDDRESDPERDAGRNHESKVDEDQRNIVNNGRDDSVDNEEKRLPCEYDNERNQDLDEPRLQDLDEPHLTEALGETEGSYSMSEDSGDHDEKMDTLQRLTRPLKRQREGSSSEDDIPLAELSRRLKRRNTNQEEVEDMISEDDIPLADLSKRLRPSTSGLGEIEAIKRLNNTLVGSAK